MSGNNQKTPIGVSLQGWGRTIAKNATEILAKSLPASLVKVMGAIAQVKYEVTGNQQLTSGTLPILGSRYIRQPFQAGELGITIGADAYMGGVSGLGGGTADLSQRGNLTTGVWAPVGNESWPSTDGNALALFGGSSGIGLTNQEGGSSVISITSSSITLSCGGHMIVIDSSGVHIDGRVFLLHEHSAVQTGPDVSGPVV